MLLSICLKAEFVKKICKNIKNDHFVSGRFDCSVACCDMEEPNGLDDIKINCIF